LCLQIGEKLGADLLVLESAALLHDVSQSRERHAERSSMEAEKILKEIGFPEEKIPHVISVIREHSFSSGLKPQSLESKILSDADKIDALGAIGIYRAIAYSVEHGRSIDGFVEHVFEKLLKLPERMETEVGKHLAKQRARFLEDFVNQLLKEL
ncbi:MAG: phosphohydrolase, partial [Candidatus Methanomethylicota archaeon]